MEITCCLRKLEDTERLLNKLQILEEAWKLSENGESHRNYCYMENVHKGLKEVPVFKSVACKRQTSTTV